MIRLRTFGPLDLRGGDGHEVHSVLAHPKRVALLVYLAATRPGGFHRRDTLAGLFWPEQDQDRARASLRKAVHMLRQALGHGVIVGRGDEELAVDAARLWCDVGGLQEALAADALVEAVELYRGDFLDGFFLSDSPEFEYWADANRTRWRDAVARAACDVARRNEAAGDPFGAAAWARRAFGLLPHDEQALRFLLGVLDRAGDRAGAIAVYETFARQLAAEFDDEPSPETQRLIESVRRRRERAAAGPDPFPTTSPDQGPESVVTTSPDQGPVSAVTTWPDQGPESVVTTSPDQDRRPAVTTSPDPGPVSDVTTSPDQDATSAASVSGSEPGTLRRPRRMARAWPAFAAVAVVLVAAGGLARGDRGVRRVAPDRLTVGTVADMALLPGGYLDGSVRAGEISFGKRFAGQELSVVDGWEVLGREVDGPLRLVTGDVGRNLYRGQHRLYGANLSGVGARGVRGDGALAVRFLRDQAELGIHLIRSNGGAATLRFYRRDGSLIGEVVIAQVQDGEYGFRRSTGAADIAGFTLHNRDPDEGLSVRRIRYAALPGTAPAASPARIAVLPLSARGGPAADSAAARTTALLQTALDGLDGRRAVAADSVRDAVAGRTVLGESGARQVAATLDAGWFVVGAASADAGRVRVRAALYGPESGTRPVAAAELDGAPGTADATAQQVTLALLARSFEVAGRHPAAEASRGAASIAWLRSYLEGEEALERGAYARALGLLTSAVERDATSAMAHYRLSQAAFRYRRWDRARELAARAVALRRAAAAGDDRERIRLEAWHALLDGRGREAEQGFSMLATGENDPDAWQGLVETLVRWGPVHGRPLAEVAQAAEHALRLAPLHAAMRAHLARLCAADGAVERADFLARTAYNFPEGERAPPWAEAELAAFRAALHGRTAHETDRLALGEAGVAAAVASIALYTGHVEPALALLEPGLRSADPQRRSEALLRSALLEAARGRPRAALQRFGQLDTVASGSAAVTRALLAAQPFFGSVVSAQAGSDGTARGARAGVMRAVDSATAVLRSRPAAPLRPGDPVGIAARYLLALTHQHEGRRHEALRWLGTIPEDDLNSVWYIAPAELRRAGLHEELGQLEEAARSYRRFLSLWREAEPELLPVVHAARARLAALEGVD